MRKKIILSVLLLVAITALVFPFEIKTKDKMGIINESEYTHYKAILWEYSYSCIAHYNDGSFRMNECITIFGGIKVYDNTEKMMLNSSGEPVPWERPQSVTYIP